MKTPGVYMIRNRTTGKFYVGSSALDVYKRWSLHRVHLKKGQHDSAYMQNAWNKYGSDDFEFKVLVICCPEHCLLYEQRFIDALSPAYNTCRVAGSSIGVKHSEETKGKFSKAQRAWRKKYEFCGEYLCLSDIADRTGFDRNTLISRVVGMGMTVDEALSKKRRVGKWVITHNGEEKTLYEWADHLGVNPKRIQSRLAKGMEFSSIVSFLNKSEKSMSFTEFCNLAGVSHTTAKSRLKSGMSLMEAITAPVNNKRISRRAA